MHDFIREIIQADHQAFLFLNGRHVAWLDDAMHIITTPVTWAPLYLLLAYRVSKVYGWHAIVILSLATISVGLGDLLASGVLKPYFQRPRPCHDDLIGPLTHLVGNCGGAYGFISAHAATSFALASAVLGMTFRRMMFGLWLFLWAAVYSYSRIYVGVHYPGDIFCGAIVGTAIGGSIGFIYRKNHKTIAK